MNLQKIFGQILSIIIGIITLSVLKGLAPGWQSGKADVTNSLTQHTFDLSSITPPNMNAKSTVIQKL
jgi:hypothetical protein